MMNLAIVVNGVTLAVPAGTVISRELETILFKRDTEAIDLTYPVDLPLTDETMVALGYPTDLANPNVVREFPAQLYVNGAAEDVITLRILKVSRKARTASVQIIGKYGTLARIFNGAMLSQLTLDGVRTIGTINTYSDFYLKGVGFFGLNYTSCDDAFAFMQDVMDETIITDYVFGLKVEENNNLDMTDGVTVINGYHFNTTLAGAPAAGYIDPVRYYVKAVIMPESPAGEDVVNTRYYNVPQFRLHYVLRKCFEEYGFTVTGDIFLDDKFRKIIIDNGYAINQCSWTLVYDPVNAPHWTINLVHNATTINPQNHMPVMSIVEWITEVSKNFNLHYDINLQARTVDIRQIADPANIGAIIDLTLQAEPNPEINFDQQGYLKGYQFSFEDTANAEVKDDIDMYVFRGWYTNFADLVSVTTPAVNDMVLLMNENAYYQYDGTDWNFYSDNMGSYKTATGATDNLEKISSKIGIPRLINDPVPLCYHDSGALKTYYSNRGDLVYPSTNTGVYGAGIFICDYSLIEELTIANEGDVIRGCMKLVNAAPQAAAVQIMNWLAAMQVYGAAVGVNYPMISPSPFGASGALQLAYALSWSFPNGSGFTLGLYADWWKQFAEILNNSIEVEYRINMDVLTASNFAWDNNIIRIDNLLWLCRKVTEVKPLPNIATATLVRI